MNKTEEAFYHLGKCLMYVADLTPDLRPKYLDDALAFWNLHNPDGEIIKPTGIGYMEITHLMYLDFDFDPEKMPK